MTRQREKRSKNASVKIDSLQTKDGKKILQRMKIEFPVNSVTAIMGPSGSGKTTLLNYISGNMSSGIKVRGKVHMNGLKVLVPQDDRLHGFYTCQSYLEHYIRLSGQELGTSRQKIKQILIDLGLTKCKDVKVGDIFMKGLSGGQKRRLSVALEAISSPTNFFLDEPTSGLDSESAFRVMKFLKKYVEKGKDRRVILTIHQPSSYLWDLIDNVILLAKGQLMYAGPRQQMESFFEVKGFPTPPNFNPPDHYVTVANDEFHSEHDKLSVEEWVDAFKKHKKNLIFAENIQQDAGSRASSRSKSRMKSVRAGDIRTALELIRRYGLNLWFNPGILIVRVFINSLLSLVVGTLFWKLGEKNSFGSVNARIGVLYYVKSFYIYMSVAVLPFTIAERSIVEKEVRNGYYHPAIYQAAQGISSIPCVALLSALGTTVVMTMTGLRESFSFFLNVFLALFCAEALAQLVSHFAPHFIIGMAILAGIYGMFMLLQGFLLIPSEFPEWLQWAYYMPFHTYSWRTLMYEEFSHEESVFDSNLYPTGMHVLRAFEIEDTKPFNDMTTLLFYGLIIHATSFIYLHVNFMIIKKRNSNF